MYVMHCGEPGQTNRWAKDKSDGSGHLPGHRVTGCITLLACCCACCCHWLLYVQDLHLGGGRATGLVFGDTAIPFRYSHTRCSLAACMPCDALGHQPQMTVTDSTTCCNETYRMLLHAACCIGGEHRHFKMASLRTSSASVTVSAGRESCPCGACLC